ncbi:bifunctional dihydrofolate reductase-thymidylate synthase [Cyclospora cayetanensis]|uniref:Bifunctional dihydrofolate reductase-thymidylate synthase n=1 Tax=Cyclospora cayetanensis TaxID=88456 RepID=A0A6P6S3P1_9EIME|nr:bifunctional dihydrofolate reductase-thymidylate synthase [Cyclospora cayetanensis]
MATLLKDASLLRSLHLSYPISIVVAMTANRGIGFNNDLPWPHISPDFRHFSHLTLFTGEQEAATDKTPAGATPKLNAVIMGRRTWESLPPNARPLKGRINIVISSSVTAEDLLTSSAAGSVEAAEDVSSSSNLLFVSPSLPAALFLLEQKFLHQLHHVFIAGGSAVYAAALALDVVSFLYITRIATPFNCDTFFPAFGPPTSPPASPEEASQAVSLHQQPQQQLEGAGLVRSDSGLWSSRTDGFEVCYISKSKAHRGVPFDFVIMERIRNCRGQQKQVDQQQQLLQEKQQTSFRAALALEVFEAKEAARGEAVAAPPKAPPLRVLPHLRGRLHEELQYLELVADILNNGTEQPDRTGVGIVSQFGRCMRFSLKETFPLLTTKRVFWRGVVEELLWFIRGDTNANNLSKLGVKIWDLNATREFLDSRGLTDREQGDIGTAARVRLPMEALRRRIFQHACGLHGVSPGALKTVQQQLTHLRNACRQGGGSAEGGYPQTEDQPVRSPHDHFCVEPFRQGSVFCFSDKGPLHVPF